MKIATTLGGGSTPRVLSGCPPATGVTAFCWHPTRNEAFLALRGSLIVRVNGETGGWFGDPWMLPKEKEEETEEDGSKKSGRVVEEAVVHLMSSAMAPGLRMVLVSAITNLGRLVCYELDDESSTVELIGEAKLKLQLNAYALSVTSGLDIAALFGLSKRSSSQVNLMLLAPRNLKKRRFGTSVALETKVAKASPKTQQPVSISCSPGISAIAVAMADGSLQVWRYSQEDLRKKDAAEDSITATSFVISPSLSNSTISPSKRKAAAVEKNSPGSVVWSRHDDKTRLIVVQRSDIPEASVWAWSASESDPSDGGRLCRVRVLNTVAPNSFVAIHALVPVAMCLAPHTAFTSSLFAVLDLENGAQLGDALTFQATLTAAAARPPQQSRPHPPPLPDKKPKKLPSPEKKLEAKKMTPEASGSAKRRQSRFNFALVGSATKRRLQFPEQIHISAPILVSGTAGIDEDYRPAHALMTQNAWIHISPVTGSVVAVEEVQGDGSTPSRLFIRQIMLSWEGSFLGSATVPIVSFPSAASALVVRFAPQPLHELPVGDATGSTMHELILERAVLSWFKSKNVRAEPVILKKPQTPHVTVIGLNQCSPPAVSSSVDPEEGDNEHQIIVRGAGTVALLPYLKFSRTAVFEPAADCCFFIAGKVAMITADRSSVLIKKFNDTTQSWERCSFKISLQYDVRRLFSTPFRWGGRKKMLSSFGESCKTRFSVADGDDDDDARDENEQDDDEVSSEWEGSVLLYCGLMRSELEFLCYSRNLFGSPYGEEDLFMLISDDMTPREERASSTPPQQQERSGNGGMIKRTLTVRSGTGEGSSGLLSVDSPPIPPLTGPIAAQYANVAGLQRSGSVALTVGEMDELRMRQKSFNQEANDDTPDSDLPPPVARDKEDRDEVEKRKNTPILLFERGERVVDIQWSRFQRRPSSTSPRIRGFWSTEDMDDGEDRLAVATTRRVLILDKRLRILAESRDIATSMTWTSPHSIAFTSSQRSHSQVLALSTVVSTGVAPLLTFVSPTGPSGPVVVCESFPTAMVCAALPLLSGNKVEIVSRPMFPHLSAVDGQLAKNDISDWSARHLLRKPRGIAKVVFSRQKVPLTTRTMLDLARSTRDIRVESFVSHEVERGLSKRVDPEFKLPFRVEEPATMRQRMLASKHRGDLWSMFESCVVLLGDDRTKDKARKELLNLVQHVRGAGSTSLVQAIRVVLGDEAVNEVADSVGGQSPRPLTGSGRYRDSSVASIAAAQASSRSDGSVRLKRKETLPQPGPATGSMLSRLPLSNEGRVVWDNGGDDLDDDELDLIAELWGRAGETVEDADDDEPDPSKYMFRKAFDVTDAMRWFNSPPSNTSKANQWVHHDEDYFFEDDVDSEEKQIRNEDRVNETAPSSTEKKKKEYDALAQANKTRRLSFGGSDESACVGYWRLFFQEEDQEADEANEERLGSAILDLSRFGNHGRLFGEEAELMDDAESCSGLEFGGRKRPYSLRCGDEGGMAVKVSDSLDLGWHQQEASRRSFTVEMWLRRYTDSTTGRINLVRRSTSLDAEEEEWVWRWGLDERDGSLEFSLRKPEPGVVVTYRTHGLSEVKELDRWNHIALVFAASSSEEEDDDEVKMFLDGQVVEVEKSLENDDDAFEPQLTDVLHFAGESLTGELLEVRFWAVPREQWEIESGKETYLNLADKLALVTKRKPSEPEEQQHRPSLSLPPPSAPNSRRPTAASLFSETFDDSSNPFDSVPAPAVAANDDYEDDPFKTGEPEPKWDFSDPQRPSPTKSVAPTAASGRGFDPFAQFSTSAAMPTSNDEPSTNVADAKQDNDPWKKIRDPETGTDYFFNTLTGVSVWTDPRVSDSPWDALQDESGSTYYYNRLTGETTWDNPDTETVGEKEVADADDQGKEVAEDDDQYTDDEMMI